MKKLIISIAVASACCFGLIFGVKASSYESTLSLGNGRSVTGATRYYSDGTNKIDIRVDSFTKYNGLSYTRLEVKYVDDLSNACRIVGTHVDRITATGHYVTDWGKLSPGDRFYTFSTLINDVVYGGVKSGSVKMTS